jgi:hypothetical protein
MVRFRYVDFYDVPRAIVLSYKGKLLLLDSPFDDKLDDYPDSYSVYELPESVETSLAKRSWVANSFLTTSLQISDNHKPRHE